MNKNYKKLRSYRWFAPNDIRSFGHRSRAMQIGYSKDDWYGEDPSNAWPLDYIVGPDFTDYNAIPKSIGGKVGDGGMRIWLESGKTDISQLKNRWLFNLAKVDKFRHNY